ncbi:MAG: hypothetical protein K8S15_01075 [Candidatus Aegiribacteria sp.]|nr:hypothetical protein [Candidatus Aegiribacteria sp.]
MTKRLLILIHVYLLLLIGCGEDSTGPSDPLESWFQQPNDVIVFMSKADSQEGELYVLNKSGEITRLTHNSLHENNPALSRDGTMIAYQAGQENNQLTWELYTADISGGGVTRLTNNGVIDAHPDWGPGDSLLVFGSFRNEFGAPAGAADIYTIKTDGTDLTQLTTSVWEDNDPEWSPDGSMITFKSNRDSQQSAREEIFVMNADGTGQNRLTSTVGCESDHDPSWSPDSRSIVFSHYAGSRLWIEMTDPEVFASSWDEFIPWNVRSVDLNGNIEELTNVEYAAGLPVFSRDGASILFLRMGFILNPAEYLIGMDHRLILIDASGGNGEQLIPDDEHTPTLEYFDW